MKRGIFLLLCSFIYFISFAQTTGQTPRELYVSGLYNEAIKLAEERRKINSSIVDDYLVVGWCYIRLGNYRSTVNISLQGLRYQANNIWLLQNLINGYFYLKEYDNLISSIERYLKNSNNNDTFLPRAYYYLGIGYFNTKAYNKADISLSITKNIAKKNNYDPKEIDILILLAEVKELLGDYKKAYEYFSIAKNLSPNLDRAINGLNRVNERL